MYQVRFYFTLALCMMMFHTVDAQNEILPFKCYSLGVEIVSTTGVGLEIATPIASKFALRAGISMFPLNYNLTRHISIADNMKNRINTAMSDPAINTALSQAGLPTSLDAINKKMDLTASLGLVNGKFLVDFYPGIISSFHLTAGLYVGKERLLNVEGKLKQMTQVLDVIEKNGTNLWSEIYTETKDYQLKAQDLMDVNGAFTIATVKPYVGLGFGRAVPKRRVGVSFDMGVFYMGAPKAKSDNANVQKMIDYELADVSDLLKYLSLYPIMSLKINIKL